MISKTHVKIMPLGDSITQGFNSSDLRGYRAPLWNLAQVANWLVDFVGSLEDEPGDQKIWRHEGHYGWRIDHLCEHMQPWLQFYRPDAILLHIGTNDILHGCSVATAITRLEQLLDCIDNALPGVKVFVAQITPLGFEALNTRLCKYNHLIPDLVHSKANEGRLIQCVDIYSAVPINTIHDKIHTNNVGYAAMAQCWFQALQVWYADFTSRYMDVTPRLMKQDIGTAIV